MEVSPKIDPTINQFGYERNIALIQFFNHQEGYGLLHDSVHDKHYYVTKDDFVLDGRACMLKSVFENRYVMFDTIPMPNGEGERAVRVTELGGAPLCDETFNATHSELYERLTGERVLDLSAIARQTDNSYEREGAINAHWRYASSQCDADDGHDTDPESISSITSVNSITSVATVHIETRQSVIVERESFLRHWLESDRNNSGRRSLTQFTVATPSTPSPIGDENLAPICVLSDLTCNESTESKHTFHDSDEINQMVDHSVDYLDRG